GLKDGEISVTVNGSNALSAEADEVAITFALTQTKPELDDGQTDLTPRYAAAGDLVTISVTFDKAVTTPTGSTLGSEVIDWTPQAGTHTSWSGTIHVAAVDDSVTSVALTLRGFTDETGNTGEAVTSGEALAMTPTIFTSEINGGADVNESESPTLILDGTTVRFSEGDKLSLSVTDSGGVKVSDAEVLVGENGVWQYELTLDPIEGGSVTVSLHGANALGADATLVESTFTLNKDVSAAVVVVPSLLRQLLIYDKGTKLAA
ncbi:hypothetical protein Q4569_22010, partial [Vibrio splendidus]|nr:hypothetical protein [Vibrio splendidus]